MFLMVASQQLDESEDSIISDIDHYVTTKKWVWIVIFELY